MNDPGLRRLVNSVLVPGHCGDTVPDWLAGEIEAGLGGACWFSGDFGTIGELHARGDVLVLTDEEGGNVTRLEVGSGSSSPGNASLGALDDVGVTERVAAGIGALARRAGVDVVLAPVVDVNSEPDNPVIGVRSFGTVPGIVARHGAAFVRGMQAQGVAACAKHFPGHGATRTDSHLGLPVVDADRETFWRRDVAPFAAAIDAGVRCVLTAHVAVPAVDSTPATMSAAWMTALRDDLGFDGVVISDALDMHAIARGVGRAQGAVDALGAGVDLISIGNPCFPEPYDGDEVLAEVRDVVIAAVESGELDAMRLEQAAQRIAALRDWLATAREQDVDLGANDLHAVGLDAARRTVRAEGEVRLTAAPHVLVEQRSDIAAGRMSSPLVTALTGRWPATTSGVIATPGDVAGAVAPAAGRPLVVVTDGLAGDGIVLAMRAERPDAVIVHTGPATPSPPSAPVVFAWGNGAANAAAAVEVLGGDR